MVVNDDHIFKSKFSLLISIEYYGLNCPCIENFISESYYLPDIECPHKKDLVFDSYEFYKHERTCIKDKFQFESVYAGEPFLEKYINCCNLLHKGLQKAYQLIIGFCLPKAYERQREILPIVKQRYSEYEKNIETYLQQLIGLDYKDYENEKHIKIRENIHHHGKKRFQLVKEYGELLNTDLISIKKKSEALSKK